MIGKGDRILLSIPVSETIGDIEAGDILRFSIYGRGRLVVRDGVKILEPDNIDEARLKKFDS